MKDQQVHIVCFDIPYPVTHGGFYDLFYKIVALHNQGIQIILHCFEYGRPQQSFLNQYCKEVYYYKRQKVFSRISFILPFIVSSRRNETLLYNLSKDNVPIILEGIHCTYILYKNCFPNRKIFLRLHNIEHLYYRQLFYSEKTSVKKFYYWFESRLLKKYEKIVAVKASTVLAVASSDVEKFKMYCPKANIEYLPVFLGNPKIDNKEGFGNYCLYHGNLSVIENEEVCIMLIQFVFSKRKTTFIIAGRNPTKRLRHIISHFTFVKLVSNPPDSEMKALIQNAHINIVFSNNTTGIKLKLLNALLYGRHCIVNPAAIEGTNFATCCTVIKDLVTLKDAIQLLEQKPFSFFDNAARRKILSHEFDDHLNVKKLIKLLY